MENSNRQVVIIGAGPAGLTAAYELTKHDIHPLVLEEGNKVGGIARTECYKGFHFDLGGHRLFTKVESINQLWREILGDDLLRRPRLSRIYYNNRFFHYPLKPLNALWELGIWQAILVGVSFIKWQIFPYKHEDTFEQWVTNRFGKRLFEIFFKTYSEKVWGIPTSELKAEFAAQRIKDLSLKTALLSMFFNPKNKIKTLIEEFLYPRQGPGMLWEAVKNKIEQSGGEVQVNSSVVRLHIEGRRITQVVVSNNGSGQRPVSGSQFISSMPISELVRRLDSVPPQILEAAKQLNYRDFLTVCLIVNKPRLFPDNWIYIHSPQVKVGRIQNFKNWSPEMVPDPSKSSLGLEYFCHVGDDFWNMADSNLIELGKKELEQIGLAKYSDVVDGCVFRVPRAYPVYDSNYREYLQIVRDFVGGIENLQTIGRNGLHRYDNLDHAMMTGILVARNLALGEHNNPWNVNTDSEYQEEGCAGEQSKVDRVLQKAMTRVFSRLDPVAFGLSVGITAGASLFVATLFLLIKGGIVVGPNLQLLDQFLPGYTVTFPGGFIGLLYAFGIGTVAGWGFAYLRNVAVYLNALTIHRDIERHLLRRFLDYA